MARPQEHSVPSSLISDAGTTNLPPGSNQELGHTSVHMARQSGIDPVHRLPSELVSRIFVYCLPPLFGLLDEGQPVFCEPPPPSLAPLLLGRISSAWRQAALSTPQLWSYVWIAFFSNRMMANGRMDLLDAWVARARSVPLILRIADEGVPAPMPDRVLVALNSRCAQIETIGLSGSAALIPAFLTHSATFTSLKTVEIALHDKAPDAELSLSDAPLLSSFTLQSRHIGFRSLSSALSWGRLTYLDLRCMGFTVDDYCTILSQCMMLVECRLLAYRRPVSKSALVSVPDRLHGPGSIYLPCLSKFFLENYTDVGRILDEFTFPALIILSMDVRSSSKLFPEQLQGFLHRSGTHISEMTLTGIEMSDVQFLRCLEHVPDLVSLSVTKMSEDTTMISDTFYSSLTVRRGDSPVLPKLQSLTFPIWYMEDEMMRAEDPLLVDMIASRWHLSPTICSRESAVSRLRELNIIIRSGGFKSSTEDELFTFKEEGLELSVDEPAEDHATWERDWDHDYYG